MENLPSLKLWVRDVLCEVLPETEEALGSSLLVPVLISSYVGLKNVLPAFTVGSKHLLCHLAIITPCGPLICPL
jgi:hypothetical protein